MERKRLKLTPEFTRLCDKRVILKMYRVEHGVGLVYVHAMLEGLPGVHRLTLSEIVGDKELLTDKLDTLREIRCTVWWCEESAYATKKADAAKRGRKFTDDPQRLVFVRAWSKSQGASWYKTKHANLDEIAENLIKGGHVLKALDAVDVRAISTPDAKKLKFFSGDLFTELLAATANGGV